MNGDSVQKSAHSTGEGGGDQAPPAYALVEHTADIGYTVEAPDLRRLFGRAALALHDIMADTGPARDAIERRIAVEGTDLDDLLVRFLEEAHWAFEGETTIFARVEVSRADEEAGPGGGFRVEAVARGERFDPARHELRRPVKAVTYHGLSVERAEGGGWKARVILDL